LGFAVEPLVLVFCAIVLARANARRVFYEHLNRWASSYEIQIEPGETQTALQLIQSQMWSDFVKIQHVETDLTSRIKAAALMFKVEFLPDAPDEPLYISLRANR